MLKEQQDVQLHRAYDEEIYRSVETLREQVRALNDKNIELEKKLDQKVSDLNTQIFQNAPPFVNYIDNGDFVFTAEQYDTTSFLNDHLVLAKWYQEPNNSTAQLVEYTTGAAGPDFIATSIFGLPATWNKDSGEVSIGSNIKIATPLPKNLGFPASSLFCRFQIKKTSGGVVIPDSWRLRASLWDNTSGQQKIVEGAPFDITANANVPSPGAFTRKYLLRVETSMDFFYSDVLTPAQVNNQVSVTNIDNVNFVQVSWQNFPEAARYRLYRHDSEFNEWRLIADIVNGATAFKDVGGRTGVLHTPPVANILPRAQALFVNFGKYVNTNLEYQDVIFHIFVPTTYNYALTTNKQWLQIDMVDEEVNHVSMPGGALLLDKVALGYTNGRFTYSSRDLQANATVQATTPPPTPPPGGGDGDGGNRPPPRGRGDRPLCVFHETPILTFTDDCKSLWKLANEIKVGDRLVTMTLNAVKVLDVIKGKTNLLYVITTENKNQLKCSASHPIITPYLEDRGTPAQLLKVGDVITTMPEGKIEWSRINSIEILNSEKGFDIVTYELEGEHTFISSGVVSHNLKPLEA